MSNEQWVLPPVGHLASHVAQRTSHVARRTSHVNQVSSMIIAIDARELCGRPTGVGRYLGEPARRVGPHGRGAHVAPVRAGGAGRARRARALGAPRARRPRHLVGAMAAAGRPGRRSSRRAFRPGVHRPPAHATSPSSLTIHDLSFVAHPEWFSWREGVRRRLADPAGGPARRRRHHGVGLLAARDPRAVRPARPARARHPFRHSPPGRTGRAGRRAAARSARAVRRLGLQPASRARPRSGPSPRSRSTTRKRGSISSARTGRIPTRISAPSPTSLGVGPQVAVRSFVPDADLAALYAGARVFAFLSEYEGFGFTPLEALSAGRADSSSSTRRSPGRSTARRRSTCAGRRGRLHRSAARPALR